MRLPHQVLFLVFQILRCEEEPGSVQGIDNSKVNEHQGLPSIPVTGAAGQHPNVLINQDGHQFNPQIGHHHHPPQYQGAQNQGSFQNPQQAQMQGNFQNQQQAQMQMQGNFQQPQMQGSFQNPVMMQPQMQDSGMMQQQMQNPGMMQQQIQNPGMKQQQIQNPGMMRPNQGNFPNQGSPNFANTQMEQMQQFQQYPGQPPVGNLPQYHQGEHSQYHYPQNGFQGQEGYPQDFRQPPLGNFPQQVEQGDLTDLTPPTGQTSPGQHSEDQVVHNVGSLGESTTASSVNVMGGNTGEIKFSEATSNVGNVKEHPESINIPSPGEIDKIHQIDPTEHGHGHSHHHDDHMEHGHGHSHGHHVDHAGHGHGHSHHHDNHAGHGHGHSHHHDNHAGHGHGHSHHHDNMEHSHEHSHGDHEDQPEHGHGHSHGHHDCNHGMGHLGKKVSATTERPPEHYKPATQDFDLPLSARFGGGGGPSFNYEHSTEASLTTESYQYSTESNIYSPSSNQYDSQDTNSKIEGELHQNENVLVGHEYEAESVTAGPSSSAVEEDSLYNTNQFNSNVEDQPDLVSEETLHLKKQQDEGLPPPPTVEMGPDWLQLLVAGSQLEFNQERLSLVTVVALSLVLMFFISGYLSSTASEGPLNSRIDQMEKKLSVTVKEILQLQQETSANNFDINENNPELRENQMKLENVRQELENSKELLRGQEMKTNSYLAEFENRKQELEAAKRESLQAEEMMEELVAEQKNKNSNEDLLSAIKQLQLQFEQQKETLKKYEPRLKKKERENKEMSLTMRQLKADAANAKLETDKLKKELNNLMKQKQEASSKYDDISKNDDEWKSLANLLQKQLDEKCDEIYEKEKSSSELKLRLTDIEKKSDSNDEQMEVLEEVIKEMRKKHLVVEEKDGWEVEGDGWNDTNEDLTDLDELKLRTSDLLSQKQTLIEKLQGAKSELEVSNSVLSKHKEDCIGMRSERDEVVREFTGTQNKLEVLTEFFNKKEAELQKQIGLQSAKFGDVSSDAEKTNSRLEIVSEDLESSREKLRGLRTELEEQERSLKCSVSHQEKAAHECWVAARQAERKVTELQSESSVLRSRLTMAEAKNFSLEKEKGELEGAIKSLQGSVKSESGRESVGSVSLPPLPGLPGGMMMLPGLTSIRPPPLGEMSPRSGSPSPREYRRDRRDWRDRRDSSGDRYSVRSDRSDRSDRYRHGPSPRSERAYRV